MYATQPPGPQPASHQSVVDQSGNSGFWNNLKTSVTAFFRMEDDEYIQHEKQHQINVNDPNRQKPTWEDAEPGWNTHSDPVKVAIIEGRFANNRAHLEILKAYQMMKVLTHPQTLLLLGATATGLFGAWHVTSLAKDVAKHYLLIPPLCTETSIHGWGDSVKGFFVYEDKSVPGRDQVILNEALQKRFEKLSYAITNAAKNDVFFRHYLFYGPPGTGKTMIAKAIAQEAGLEYMYFSAANLEQYSLEEGIQQISHLFEYAKAFPKKLMIIMDEADSIFAHRDTASDKARTFLNKILTYTGTEQNNYIVIAITNRPQDFDEAALSRFGVKIKVDAPGFEERKKIFAQYAFKYLIQSYTVNRDQRSLFQMLFNKKPVQRLPLIVDDAVLSDETFNELARRSDGLTGREISDVMSNVQHEAYGYPDHRVTQEMLFEALVNKIQDSKVLQDFKHNKLTAAA